MFLACFLLPHLSLVGSNYIFSTFPLSRQRLSSTSSASDHEYGQSFSTPQSLPSSGGRGRTAIYLTPSSSGGTSSLGRHVGGGRTAVVGMGPTSIMMVPQPKTEARRRLNLDAAPVDPEGFKTPQKQATKRRVQDLSSPSPKKSKLNGYRIYRVDN